MGGLSTSRARETGSWKDQTLRGDIVIVRGLSPRGSGTRRQTWWPVARARESERKKLRCGREDVLNERVSFWFWIFRTLPFPNPLVAGPPPCPIPYSLLRGGTICTNQPNTEEHQPNNHGGAGARGRDARSPRLTRRAGGFRVVFDTEDGGRGCKGSGMPPSPASNGSSSWVGDVHAHARGSGGCCGWGS